MYLYPYRPYGEVDSIAVSLVSQRFVLVPANIHSFRLLERAAGLTRHDLAEAERIRYMERILEYYVPNISFDVHSLRKTVEELKNKHRGSDSDGPSTRVDVDELEDLAIEDEDFTIKALPDNTTRKFWFGISMLWANMCRIFGRIFVFEFLHEN